MLSVDRSNFTFNLSEMPDNKNSGRKKRAVTEEIAPLSKKKVVRPKKENVLAEICDETTIYNEVIVVDVSNEMVDSDSDARKAEHSPLQLWDLRKRTSDISIFYDTYLGTTLDHFPSSKLPLQRAVLRRYRSLLTVDDAQKSKSDMSTTITAEIIPLWESSCIPTKIDRGCWDAVKQCVTMWVDAKQDVKKTPAFQNGLDNLLDLRPIQNRSLSSLRDYLKMAGNPEWEEDYKLFKGQLKHPQTGTISSTKDVQLQKKVQKTASRQAKASSYIERNQDELSASTSSNVTPKNVFDDVCEDNILLVKVIDSVR